MGPIYGLRKDYRVVGRSPTAPPSLPLSSFFKPAAGRHSLNFASEGRGVDFDLLGCLVEVLGFVQFDISRLEMII